MSDKKKTVLVDVSARVRAWFTLDQLLDECVDGGKFARKLAREGNTERLTAELRDCLDSAMSGAAHRARFKMDFDIEQTGLDGLVEQFIEEEKELMAEEAEEAKS